MKPAGLPREDDDAGWAIIISSIDSLLRQERADMQNEVRKRVFLLIRRTDLVYTA